MSEQESSSIDLVDQKMLGLLNDGFGHKQSRKVGQCVDANNIPIPWYTYPAIEYLRDINLSTKVIFEYGCGNSSVFFAGYAKKVISVESDKDWFNKTKSRNLKNLELHFCESQNEYVNLIANYSEFDIIVIDGHSRLDCASISVEKLKKGGVIILDNSDWHVNAAAKLRNSNLIQVDMKGFGPINPYCWCTSFFFDRNYCFEPRDKHQPMHGIGSRDVIVTE